MDSVPAELKTQFLEDHVAISMRRNPRSMGETAIRLGSSDMRDLLAARAVSAQTDFAGLLAALDAGVLGTTGHVVDHWYLAELARVIAIQRFEPGDPALALRLYEFLLSRPGVELDSRHRALYLHLRAELTPGRGGLPRSHPPAHASVTAMLECNRLHRPGPPRRSWLRALGRLLNADCALSPGDGPALDRLEAVTDRVSNSAHLVSIVLPVDGENPMRGLRSVARQNHSEIELLVVTSGPLGPEAAAVVDGIEGARVIQVDGANTGTLVNHGIRAASAEYLLVLAPGDWCVPQLVEVQLRRVRKRRSAVVACRTARLRADANLRLGPFGVAGPEILSKSLFLKREVVDRLGYFDTVGPEAIEEYAKRIREAFGKGSVSTARGPLLALTPDERELVPHLEIEEGAESPWFTAYSSGFTRWHRRCTEAGTVPYLPFEPADRPFALPLSQRPGAGAGHRYDLVFASDWRPYGGPAKSMLEEIAAARRIGLRVGVMNLESVRMMAPLTRAVCGPVQRLVDAGEVDLLVPSDPVDVDTLVIRYPLVLQFDRTAKFACKVGRVLIHANQPPCEADGSDLRYFVHDCEANARHWFGVEPSWVPQGPQARQALLEAPVPPRSLEDFDLPGILEPTDWLIRRDDFRSDRPVLGRHSRDHITKWPSDADTLLQIYPDDPAYDFRNMGGASTPAEVLGGRLPYNWIAYGYDETDVKDFLFQLDFWVYFPNEIRIEAFGRAILEAMASGCVVILPEVFRSTFGEGALYCRPDEVRNLIDKYRSDLGVFLTQSRRGQDHVREHFSYEWYQRLIGSRLLKSRA
ncbi:glycosyltransferase [Glycomyces sp. NPDC046736]|uniref:glycosyltransferase n=1 Tax=Glycomyces sp. NPDC046736 TaxID=3155615 RepID=UPI0033C8C0C9